MVETKYRLDNTEELHKELKRQYLLGKLQEFSRWTFSNYVSIEAKAIEFGGDDYELEINGQKIYINKWKKWILRRLIANLWQEYMENNRVHSSIDIDDYITIYVKLDNETIDSLTIYEELMCCIIIRLPPKTDMNRFLNLLNKYFEIFE